MCPYARSWVCIAPVAAADGAVPPPVSAPVTAAALASVADPTKPAWCSWGGNGGTDVACAVPGCACNNQNQCMPVRGQDLACLPGWKAVGDGSACDGRTPSGGTTRCALWGNPGLPACHSACKLRA